MSGKRATWFWPACAAPHREERADMAGRSSRWSGRFWLGALIWIAVFVSTALAARSMQRFVSADRRFALLDPPAVEGAVYASRARILRIFAPDAGRSVFLMPLAERRRRLLAIDWIEDASVSRIWPNRIVVRITERKPVAFLNLPLRNTPGAVIALIDSGGVILDPPPKARFTFPVLSGVSEEQSEAERRERVGAMLRLMKELGPAGKELSEVNVASMQNLRVITRVEGRAAELMLGNRNFARRYQNFLDHYPEIHNRARNATAFDLRLDDRITVKE
jgi:cell division protein FtsQ